MNVKLESIDLSRALAKGDSMGHHTTAVVTIAAREDTKPFVPMLKNGLRASAETESDPEHGLIVYGSGSVPYARAQYYANDTDWHRNTPGTCSQWFEASKAANLSKWIREAKDGCRGISNA